MEPDSPEPVELEGRWATLEPSGPMELESGVEPLPGWECWPEDCTGWPQFPLCGPRIRRNRRGVYSGWLCSPDPPPSTGSPGWKGGGDLQISEVGGPTHVMLSQEWSWGLRVGKEGH